MLGVQVLEWANQEQNRTIPALVFAHRHCRGPQHAWAAAGVEAFAADVQSAVAAAEQERWGLLKVLLKAMLAQPGRQNEPEQPAFPASRDPEFHRPRERMAPDAREFPDLAEELRGASALSAALTPLEVAAGDRVAFRFAVASAARAVPE